MSNGSSRRRGRACGRPDSGRPAVATNTAALGVCGGQRAECGEGEQLQSNGRPRRTSRSWPRSVHERGVCERNFRRLRTRWRGVQTNCERAYHVTIGLSIGGGRHPSDLLTHSEWRLSCVLPSSAHAATMCRSAALPAPIIIPLGLDQTDGLDSQFVRRCVRRVCVLWARIGLCGVSRARDDVPIRL